MGLLTEYPDWWVIDPGKGHPPASLLKYLLVQAAYSSFSVRGEPLWRHFLPCCSCPGGCPQHWDSPGDRVCRLKQRAVSEKSPKLGVITRQCCGHPQGTRVGSGFQCLSLPQMLFLLITETSLHKSSGVAKQDQGREILEDVLLVQTPRKTMNSELTKEDPLQYLGPTYNFHNQVNALICGTLKLNRVKNSINNFTKILKAPVLSSQIAERIRADRRE